MYVYVCVRVCVCVSMCMLIAHSCWQFESAVLCVQCDKRKVVTGTEDRLVR